MRPEVKGHWVWHLVDKDIILFCEAINFLLYIQTIEEKQEQFFIDYFKRQAKNEN